MTSKPPRPQLVCDVCGVPVNRKSGIVLLVRWINGLGLQRHLCPICAAIEDAEDLENDTELEANYAESRGNRGEL